ncbi:DNA-binding transcriptional regulator, LysR family [Modestobacter sp. DSM 44400]|nr:DNA-binding transcriptional regulator, LysR family [Modestobacter sp. DSM 44400]
MLDLLVSVAEAGSLGRAAALHRISQPAASQRLARLERQLDLQLLTRTPTGSRLTPDGEVFLGWARRVVDQAEQLVIAVEALKSRAADVLEVAASLTIADFLFPRWLGALHQVRPGERVSLRVGNSAAVADLVRDGQVVLGFTEAPQLPPGLRSRAIGGDRLVVVVHPDHPWAGRRRPLPVTTLAAEALLVREPGSGTRAALEEALTAAGLRLLPALELGSTAALKSAAISGEGPAVLSELSVVGELADDRLSMVPIAGADLRRPFHAIWHLDRPPTGTAAGLLAIAGRPRPPRRVSASTP